MSLNKKAISYNDSIVEKYSFFREIELWLHNSKPVGAFVNKTKKSKVHKYVDANK